MSEIHIREKDTKDKTANCVFHFLVPATQNSVGMDWNEVIQKAKLPEPIMADNDTTENAAIVAGNIFELACTVGFSSTNLTNAQRLVEIEDFYTDKKATVFATLAFELDFFGKEINT